MWNNLNIEQEISEYFWKNNSFTVEFEHYSGILYLSVCYTTDKNNYAVYLNLVETSAKFYEELQKRIEHTVFFKEEDIKELVKESEYFTYLAGQYMESKRKKRKKEKI